MKRKNVAVILAAGKGERMKSSIYKQHIKILDKYMYEYSIINFLSIELIDEIVLVVDKEHYEQVKKNVKEKYKKVMICVGGETRRESLDNAINYIKGFLYKEIMNVNIISHDAARLFVHRRIIEENIQALEIHNVVNTIVPISDSITVIENRQTIDYPNRSLYYNVQTPQSFRLDKYIIVNFRKIDKIHEINDVVKLFFLCNFKIYNVVGEKINFKITDQTDLKIADALIRKKI